MTTQKNLQMVLTTLLLVLAILAFDWQDRSALKSVAAATEPETEIYPVNLPVYTNCCLQHALQAAEGKGMLKGRNYPVGVLHAFEPGSLLLLQNDSTKRIAVAHF